MKLLVKRALVNVYNPNDNLCFAWAYIPALYPMDTYSTILSNYRPYLNSIYFTGMSFPVPIQVARFQRNSPIVSTHIFTIGNREQEIIHKFVLKGCKPEKHMTSTLCFPLQKTDDKCHYVWIKTWLRWYFIDRIVKTQCWYVSIVYIRSQERKPSITIIWIARNMYIRL